MNARLTTSLAAAVLALAAMAGCYTGSAVDTNAEPQVVTQTNGTDPAGDDDDTSHVATASGLPCDLAVLLQTSCGHCHGDKPVDDAPRLLTYDDLVAKSAADPSKAMADIALARMKSTQNPMPPDGKLGTDEIGILETWIDGGMPKGSCGTDAKTDGGASDGGHNSQTTPPAVIPTVCTSGVSADPMTSDATMHPGRACISCHSAESGPSFTVAGTVFPTVREPDECNGANGTTDGLKVLIIDAKGVMRALTVNAAGNFTSPTSLPTPYRAIVVRGNSIKEMRATQTDGDCNGCHTENGAHGAPGRLMEP